jgi:2',3'-cyclic-nucleotide 2'-phosphodiesterase (5'-nucleotidase family)
MPDAVVVRKIPGHLLKKLLENGVSQYPKYDGRWLATSGFKYSFDPEKPPGERIIIESLVLEDGTPMDLERSYSVATKHFVTAGKDGFDDFLDPAIEELPPAGDEALEVQVIFDNFLKNFRRSNAELEELCKSPKFNRIF